jgi:hypothetical protein
VFFVEAKYHHNPKRAADQVRWIAHREEGLRDGQRRDLCGIGERYRAFRGDENAIRQALVEDARGLRNPVYFRFILTVDNRAAERFARLDGRLAERVLRDSVDPWRRANRGPALLYCSTSSTRRFFARPASSRFEATGASGPTPSARSRPDPTANRVVSACTTAVAR